MKEKILISVLCGKERANWINPELSVNLFNLARDTRFDVALCVVKDAKGYAVARNIAMRAARDNGCDWLLSFDNDNFLPLQSNVLDVIAEAGPGQDVIGLTSGVTATNGFGLFPSQEAMLGNHDGPFVEVAYIGTGVFAVRKTVWQKIPRGPWFHWPINETTEIQDACGGEDVEFCQRVRSLGLHVWTHQTLVTGHYKTMNCTDVVCTVANLMKQ